jgi:hypothetical protein
MKRMIALTFLAATLISMGSARAHAQATGSKASEGCSVATLNGAYGLVLTGQVLQVGPIVSVGVSTFDGKGKFVTDQTLNVNGNVFPGQGSGTYTVNRNCTGIADAVGAGPHSFVIIADGKEMDLMDNNSAEVLTIHFTKVGSGMNDHHED